MEIRGFWSRHIYGIGFWAVWAMMYHLETPSLPARYVVSKRDISAAVYIPFESRRSDRILPWRVSVPQRYVVSFGNVYLTGGMYAIWMKAKRRDWNTTSIVLIWCRLWNLDLLPVPGLAVDDQAVVVSLCEYCRYVVLSYHWYDIQIDRDVGFDNRSGKPASVTWMFILPESCDALSLGTELFPIT